MLFQGFGCASGFCVTKYSGRVIYIRDVGIRWNVVPPNVLTEKLLFLAFRILCPGSVAFFVFYNDRKIVFTVRSFSLEHALFI